MEAGRKMKRVLHVNNLKKFDKGSVSIHRVVLAEELDGEFQKDKLVLRDTELSKKQNKDLDIVLRRHVFSDKPGETEIAQHRIVTTTEDPVVVHPYRLCPAWKDQVREELEQLLQAGIIRESTSPWASPIVPVRKSDGKIRLCIDFRRLNAVTKPDLFYMPLVDEIIDEWERRSFFRSSTSPKDSTRFWYMQRMLRRRHLSCLMVNLSI